jgi:hypothetical protein
LYLSIGLPYSIGIFLTIDGMRCSIYIYLVD